MRAHIYLKKMVAAAAAALLLVQMAMPVQAFAEAPEDPAESLAAEEAGSPPAEADAEPAGEEPAEAPEEAGEAADASTATDLAAEELAEPYDVGAAAENEQDGNVFEIAGLEVEGGDELDPTGERGEMQPYGAVELIQSSDLFVFGTASGKDATATPPYSIYGVKDPAVEGALAELTLAQQMQAGAATTKSGNLATAFGDRSAVASVAFNPTLAADNYRRRSATAMLALTKEGKGPFVFAVTDRLDAGDPSVHVIKEFSYKTDDDSLNNTNIQEELYIEALDLDGDGQDEIAFLLPGEAASDHARLLIYKQKGDGENVTAADNWVEIFNQKVTEVRMGQSIKDDSRRMRTHSLAVGDLNGDGLDDIAVTGTTTTTHIYPDDASGDYSIAKLEVFYTTGATAGANGYTYTPAAYKYDSRAKAADNSLFSTGSGALLPQPTPASVGFAKKESDFYKQFAPWLHSPKMNSLKLYPIQLGVTIGDSDGNGQNELLLGYNLLGTLDSNLGSAYGQVWSNAIAYTVERLVHTSGGLARETAPDGTAILNVSVVDIGDADGDFDDTYEKKLGAFFTPARSADEATSLHFGNGGTYQNYGAVRLAVAQMAGPEAPASIILSNNRHNAQNAQANQFALAVATNANKKGPSRYFPISQIKEVCGVDAEYYSLRPAAIGTSEGVIYGYVTHYLYYNDTDEARHDYVEFVTDSGTPYHKATRLGKFHRYAPVAVALPCTDRDFVLLEYLDHQYSYTDPTVVAALASNPYYQDIENRYPGYCTGGESSYETNWGIGHGTSESSTTSLGAYVSTAAELGTKFAKAIVESETNYNHSWLKETEEMVTRIWSKEYATAGEDSVVMVTYPVDQYTYKMTTFADDFKTPVTNDYTINVPYEPVASVVSLDTYNKIYAEYPDDLPDIDGEVFTHTKGEPSSYPASAFGYANALVSAGKDSNYNSGANLVTTNSLTIDKTKSENTVTSNSVDFSIGGGAQVGYEGAVAVANFKATVGFNFGKEWSQGTINTQSDGTTYTGKVNGNPAASLNGRYGFSWQMMQYNYSDGKHNFPVVTYLVSRDVKALSLPERFEIDHNKTTNKSVTLRWSPAAEDKEPGTGAVQYLISRAEPNGSTVPYDNLVSQVAYNADTKLYSVTVPGLSPATRYEFELSCKPETGGSWTVPTPPVWTITNPDAKQPKFTIQPQNLELTAGITGELAAEFDLDGANYQVEYRWEILTEDGWAPLVDLTGNLEGMDKPTLTFKVPKTAHAGTYRLGAKITFSGGNKTFYSDLTEVTVTKQKASLALSGVDALVAPNVEMLTPTVEVRPAANMQLATGAKVVFALTHVDGDVAMASKSVASAEGGVISCDGLRLPKGGEYTLEAYYVGDSIHGKSYAAAPVTFIRTFGEGGGSYLTSTFPDTMTYGGEKEVLVTYYYTDAEGNAKKSTIRRPLTEVRRRSDNVLMEDWVYDSTLHKANVIRAKATGEYQAIISHEGASVKKNFTVVPRQSRYTVKSMTGRLGVDTISLDNVTFSTASDSTIAAEVLKYLGAFDAEGNPVTLDNSTPPGVYTIGLVNEDTLRESLPNYELIFTPGTYTVLTDKMQIYYSAENPRHGAVSATTDDQPLASGGIVKFGMDATFTATPAKGYRLAGWLVTTERSSTEVPASGDSYSIADVGEDYDVQARFVPDVTVKSVTVAPAAATVDKGAYTAPFTAQVVGGSTGKVSWSFADLPEVTAEEAATISAACIQTLPDNSCRVMVPASYSFTEVKLRATAVDDTNAYRDALITLTGNQVAPRVLDVAITPRQNTITAGARLNFQTQVTAEGGADTAVNIEVTGAEKLHETEGVIDGLTAGTEPGAVITVTASSVVDPEITDSMTMVVVPAGGALVDDSQAEDIRLEMDYVVLEAGSAEQLRIGLSCRSSTIVPGKPSLYKLRTNRQTPADGNAPTATLSIDKKALYVAAGAATAGDSFVVRVPAESGGGWAECRVDIAPKELNTGKMEPRSIEKEVTVYVYKAEDILVRVDRSNDADAGLVPWTLRNPKLRVSLAKQGLHADLDAAFMDELEVVDDGHLRLVPTGPDFADKLKKRSYTKVALELSLVEGDTVTPLPNALSGTFTLKINKSLPKITAEKLVLDTWGAAAGAVAVFKGGVVTALEGTLSNKVKGWLSHTGTETSFTVEQGRSGKAAFNMYATVEGWTKPVKVKLNITAVGSAPGLKLKSSSVKLYKQHALSTGVAMTLQAKKKADSLESMKVDGIAVVTEEGAAPRYAAVPAGDFTTTGNFTLKALTDISAKETVKLQVSFRGSRAGKVLPLTVTVRPVSATPKLKLAKTSVSLNAAYGESTSIPIASTVADYDLKNLNLTVDTSSNAANVLLPVVEGLGAGKPVLKLSAGSNPTAGKTSKFVLNLWAKPYSPSEGVTEEGQKLVHKVTVSVKVADKAAKVKLTAKGKLDVSRAAPAPVRVTAKLDGHLGAYDTGAETVKLAIYRKENGAYTMVYNGTKSTLAEPNFTVARTAPGGMEWQISAAPGGTIEPGSYRVVQMLLRQPHKIKRNNDIN